MAIYNIVFVVIVAAVVVLGIETAANVRNVTVSTNAYNTLPPSRAQLPVLTTPCLFFMQLTIAAVWLVITSVAALLLPRMWRIHVSAGEDEAGQAGSGARYGKSSRSLSGAGARNRAASARGRKATAASSADGVALTVVGHRQPQSGGRGSAGKTTLLAAAQAHATKTRNGSTDVRNPLHAQS